MKEMTELNERVAERAVDEGLVDVGYAPYDSPLGTLWLAATPRGLVTLSYSSDALDRLSQRVSPRMMEVPRLVDAARRELDEYFAGRRQRFDVDLDWSLIAGFGKSVLEATARIPYGAVSTYREVAEEAGNRKAARAAGNALGSNPIAIVIPCHRVLHSGGGLGGYGGGLAKKEYLLQLEGAR